jgi:hypothetical protein
MARIQVSSSTIIANIRLHQKGKMGIRFFLGGFAVFLSSCSLFDPPMDGELSRTVYAIQNNSADTVFAVFHNRASEDTTAFVPPDSTLDFFEDYDWGIIPPQEAFIWLKAFRKGDTLALIHQDPIIDSLWSSIDLPTSGDRSHVRYTLNMGGP